MRGNCDAVLHDELNAMAGGCPYCHEEPAFILGAALAHWVNKPPIDTVEQREAAAVEYRLFLDEVCKNWGIKIERVP